MARQAVMTRDDVKQRAATAREYLQVAQEQVAYVENDPGPSAAAQVSASNAIMAGIAAADAICGKNLGVRASDQDHRAAADLLRTVLPDGEALAKKLLRLVRDKSLLQYGGFCTTKTAAEMVKQAKSLIDSMTTVHLL